MNFRALTLSLLIVSSSATGATIDQIDVGDVYYLDGFGENPTVQVLRINKDAGKVKIRSATDGFTDWVSPSRLLSKSENVGHETAEGAIYFGLGAAAICAMFDNCREKAFSGNRSDSSNSSIATEANPESTIKIDKSKYYIGFDDTNVKSFRYNNADYEYGVRVERVIPGMAAAASGLKRGDIIYKVDDSNVTNMEFLLDHINKKPGTSIKLSYLRNEQLSSIALTPTKYISE